FLSRIHLLAGELTTAERMLEEDRLIAEATGNEPLRYGRMTLAAWRGDEALASELIEASAGEAAAHGGSSTGYATAVLHNGRARAVPNNGPGRHGVARDAARPLFERDAVGYGPFLLPELAEAASRTDE